MRLKFASLIAAAFAISFFAPASVMAGGHIAPVGVTVEDASQLIVWYDQSAANDRDIEGSTVLQVTNGSTDTAVNIHVQIFADDIFDSTNRCREHDFNDTLTRNDTVLYVIGNLNLADNFNTDPNDPGGGNLGNAIPIDVDDTRGFIVITPVDTVTLPRQAIAFNHLFASVYIFSINDEPDVLGALAFNAMGREAVDFATGALAADGTLLDGINNGYRVLQPSFLSFAWDDVETQIQGPVHLVSIAFSDIYSDSLGEYRAVSATALWDPFMFNQFEQGTSCQQHVQTCFVTIGLNADWESDIGDIDPSYDDIRLCPAVETNPGGNGGAFEDDIGWVNIAISGLGGLDNNMAIFAAHENGSENYARWLFGD